jgi:hypothetical protein
MTTSSRAALAQAHAPGAVRPVNEPAAPPDGPRVGGELATGRHPGAVVRLFRAWRVAGAEEDVVDFPTPLDDETIERLAGPVRERLA